MTPMPTRLVRLKVADYRAWKAAFDDQGDVRRANGSLGFRLFRDSDDLNEIVSLLA
jgi:hypothetical protein